ncbi:MAG: DUF1905 domain-containing protein [Allosphingosinicella sp.]
MEDVRFSSPLLVWPTERHGGMGYLIIAGEAAAAISTFELIRRLELGRRGFGSVKVEVTVGDSLWSTSVFPQKDGKWFLPIKKAACRAEGLLAGDEVEGGLHLL